MVYAAFCCRAWPAAAYWLGCGVVTGMPLLYADRAVEHNLARELFILVLTYAIVGSIVFAGREVLAGLSRRATALGEKQARMAAEQSSLRRVAMAVAAGSPPQAIFALVSAEAGRLLGADAAAIGRFLGERRVHATGVWAASGEPHTEAGQIYELEPADELVRLYATGRPVRMFDGDGAHESKTRALGYASFVAAPVYEGASVWGTLGVAAHRANAFPPGRRGRLSAYTEMIATAVRNAEDRSRLDHQGRGGPAHRSAQPPRLPRAAGGGGQPRPPPRAAADGRGGGRRPLPRAHRVRRPRARRRGAGRDRRTAALGRARRGRGRAAGRRRVRHRVPRERPQHGAAGGRARAPGRRRHAAAPRGARHGVRRPLRPRRRPVGGRAPASRRRRAVLEQGSTAATAAGSTTRRSSAISPPPPVAATSRPSRASPGCARSPARSTPRTRSRASTPSASRPWPPGSPPSGGGRRSASSACEAAALHDVGKIGVPDAVLLKPGRLDRSEMALMREHAALGARIVGDVLDDMQVRWIAAHHERPDGKGYPNGLTATEIPDGAALLALADAWDSMVSARVYSPPRAIRDALDEIRAPAGRQFTHEAVEALEALHERGGLAMAAARMHRPTPEPATPQPA